MIPLFFDSLDDLPDPKVFDFAVNHYWVIAFKNIDRPVFGSDWLMSPGRPKDVPNGQMAWRRPTYDEFLHWLKWWHVFNERPDGHLDQYRRSPDEVSIPCMCQHDKASHFIGTLTGPACRMSCGCRRYEAQDD